jgi:ankyrin repeat protein
MNAQSNIDIPESKEDFDKLDFGTQCAVAGLQLGRTKVFLRREAFDRIESLRAILYGKSACIIQAQIRGRVQRIRYFRLKVATAKTQAAIRYFLANLGIIRQRKREAREKWASSTIQLAYRRYRFRTLGADKRDEMLYSATIIQAFARSFLVRLHLDDIMPDEGTKHVQSKEEKRQELPAQTVHVIQSGPSMLEISLMLAKKTEMFQLLAEGKWDAAIALMDQYKQLAEQSEDETGRLPLHIVAEHNLHSVFDQVYKHFAEAANAFDGQGRLPIHVAAEHDALVPLRYLLSKNPEGADTMMLRPAGRIGGGIPLHVACRVNASSSVITALLSSNFNSTKKSDANGDLPVHLLLRNGDQVSGAVAQALLDIYPTAATRADMYGDLPLSVALKHKCKPEVVKVLLMHNPDAAKVQNGRDGHSPLFLAFQNHANDKTILGLMNHAPDVSALLTLYQVFQSVAHQDYPSDLSHLFIYRIAYCGCRQEIWNASN